MKLDGSNLQAFYLFTYLLRQGLLIAVKLKDLPAGIKIVCAVRPRREIEIEKENENEYE